MDLLLADRERAQHPVLVSAICTSPRSDSKRATITARSCVPSTSIPLGSAMRIQDERLSRVSWWEKPFFASSRLRSPLIPTIASRCSFPAIVSTLPNAWISKRAPLLSDEDTGDEIFEFDNWRALACYFLDQAGNIVELIAHRDFESSGRTGRFAAAEILGFSELELVIADKAAAVSRLQEVAGIGFYQGEISGSCPDRIRRRARQNPDPHTTWAGLVANRPSSRGPSPGSDGYDGDRRGRGVRRRPTGLVDLDFSTVERTPNRPRSSYADVRPPESGCRVAIRLPRQRRGIDQIRDLPLKLRNGTL